MNYEALRAVFRRANAPLATNWSMHALWHTAALHMARDKRLSLRDVQTIFGHAHPSTTADIYLVEDEEQVIARVQEYLADAKERVTLPPPSPAIGHEASDLDVLFGGDLAWPGKDRGGPTPSGWREPDRFRRGRCSSTTN
ncbi:tyrosine-type recombinase/integrase [Streptomyces sp. NPDC056638]|uniref:tyrosine-type recombinase/integrase n=1 Tax=Streptomyces sp. NPDC056638 TaxID=3345887 RepID=UPI003690A804